MSKPLLTFFNFIDSSEEVQLLRSQVQESKSLCQAAEVERDRLLELVSLLQGRYCTIDGLPWRFRGERRRSQRTDRGGLDVYVKTN